MSSRKRAYPEGEVDEHKESDNDAAAAAGSDSASAAAAAASVASPASTQPRADDSGAAAAASSPAVRRQRATGAAAAAVLLPPPAELPDCKLCNHPFESSEKRGDESSGRVPRMLPCGHCYCSKCIEQMLQRSDNVVTCPQRCPFEHKLRVDSVAKLPKNFALIDLLDQAELIAARVELGSPPCQQCDPSQPRRIAKHWCKQCMAYLCAEHELLLHAAPAFSSHQRMTLAARAKKLQAAAKPNVLLMQAAAPIKDKLEASREQIQKLHEESQKLIPALEQKHREHRDEQSALVTKLRQFADQLENTFKQQQELLNSNRRDLVERQLQIAPLQAEIDALLSGGDLGVATRGDALQNQCTELLKGAKKASAHVQSTAVHSGCLLSLGLQLQLLASESAILQPRHAPDMDRFFKGISLEGAQLLYRASRDGFAAGDLWQRCAGKGLTLTLVKVAGNGFVCGAFTPISWPDDAATRKEYVADPSGRTFLFSLENAHGRAVKLRLKAEHRDKALNLSGDSYGPGFGSGADLLLMWCEVADERRGCYIKPVSFEVDDETEAAAGLPPIPFAYDKTLLAGGDGKKDTLVGFSAAEIEVYQL